ncbi:MAG: type III pantothenate kinase [Rhodocyclaceae bacterium]|nr:type III pantothenate kinase [Rhodocyclaceae bacterium]
MILCLDCGNTRIKWGLHDGERWCGGGALATIDAAALVRYLPLGATFDRIIGCNVAGAAVAAAVASALPGAAVRWNAACSEQGGVLNGYDRPAQLGADRWAALIGARALHRGDCLVINAGTATTVDALDAAGYFRGGLILPGLSLMRASLAQATAQLPAARGRYSELPTNTDDAIESGIIHATLGAIERMFRALGAVPDARCLLSGGAAADLATHLTLPVLAIDNLVLEGLARLAVDV